MPCGIIKEKQAETATVILERQDMCGDCHACEMLSGKKACQLTCQCDIPCEAGDTVEIELTDKRFIKATYIIYGIPLVGLVVGMLLGYGIGRIVQIEEELLGVFGAVLGIGLGFLFIHIKEKRKQFAVYLPKIIRKKEN